jgi:hypothetical protein
MNNVMEKPKVRKVVGWRQRATQVRETRIRTRASAKAATLALIKKKA